MSVYVCVSVYACARACVRGNEEGAGYYVCVCTGACVCVCVCVCVCERDCVFM